MKNKIVKYEEKKIIPYKKKKPNIKKLILPIIVILIIISIIVFISNLINPSNKAKRYLEKNGYICNKQTCTKDINNNIYTFNYEKLVFYIDTPTYYITISNNTPIITIKDDEYVCTFSKDNYEAFTLVDNSFTYNKVCETYIDKVNNHIQEYKEIITSSKINVNSNK